MGMGSDRSASTSPVAEINVTPLIDVMLVVLIIFMISIPVLTHKVQIDLPQGSDEIVGGEKPDPIRVRIENDGRVLWNNEAMTTTQVAYYMAQAGKQDPQPEVRLSIGDQARYEMVATVMTQARNADIGKIGFDGQR